MQLTIDTEVLQNRGLTLDEFLVLLIGYYNVPYERILHQLTDAKVVQPNLFDRQSMVLSNNSKDFIARLIMESDVSIQSSPDFATFCLFIRQKSGEIKKLYNTQQEIALRISVHHTQYSMVRNMRVVEVWTFSVRAFFCV